MFLKSAGAFEFPELDLFISGFVFALFYGLPTSPKSSLEQRKYLKIRVVNSISPHVSPPLIFTECSTFK